MPFHDAAAQSYKIPTESQLCNSLCRHCCLHIAFIPHAIFQQAINFGFDVPAGVRIGSRLASNYRISDIAAAAVLDHLDTMAAAQWVERVASHAGLCSMRTPACDGTACPHCCPPGSPACPPAWW